MEEKYLAAKQKLERYHQEHLLNYFDKLSEEEKIELLDDILTIDFNQMEELYELTKKEESFKNSKIEPIAYVEKAKLSKEERQKYTQIGEDIIRAGKYAVVTMAGGQGTRLGHDGPKGTFDIGLKSHKSIFEILCDKMKEARDTYHVDIPWYIMTSEENNEDTIHFFEDHQYFGYPKECVSFFVQGKLPMIDPEGKVLLTEKGTVKQAADGHGGVFESMRRNGIIYDMLSRGVEWTFIGLVDNVLAKLVDPILIGLTIDRKVLASGTSIVKRDPTERVGVYCKRDGKPGVVEYTEITKEMSEARDENGELYFGEANMLCNLFSIKVLDDIANNKLPYHKAFKKAQYIDSKGNLIVPEKPNAYKFETFLFDAFESLDDMAILRVKREEEFAPVKNAEGSDSPETARKLYEDYYHLN